MTDIVVHLLLIILMPPLLLGIIARTKAVFAGRTGAPYLQPYYDILRLLRKGSVFSGTTTWVFRAGPVVTLAAIATAALLIPLGNHPAPLAFTGDMILFAYLFGLARFFTMAAALDTGSSFEGMGAAREATFSCLAEPTLFFALVVLARLTGSLSLTNMLTRAAAGNWLGTGAAMLLLTGGLFIILLAENCRIPFDDPNTHLELTMVHEVMVLDHSGPAFGYILYGAALKLFVLGAFFIQVALPFKTGVSPVDWVVFIGTMILLAIVIGVVESIMARLKLIRIPQMLVAATILSAFAMLLMLR
ncbi:respiratory chain complex I subunit 1 family protein [Geobacter sp. AOG1]|uniref:respiratory chain complex I subunit 1 family protein n=1 Tax=Geobacter sp. AOG1 TaxID=1566346 RepID=UPI001CC5CDEA|nr:NADH-quinone oxidoreductase subunit H [Geobacter sp. AOG1]GFE57496.1 hydrogenase [Geobacter sp. AOG1]